MALAADDIEVAGNGPRSYQNDDFEGYLCNPRACAEHDRPSPHCRCGVHMDIAVDADQPLTWICFWCRIEEQGFNLTGNPAGLHAVFMYLSTDVKERINGNTGMRL